MTDTDTKPKKPDAVPPAVVLADHVLTLYREQKPGGESGMFGLRPLHSAVHTDKLSKAELMLVDLAADIIADHLCALTPHLHAETSEKETNDQ